MLRHQLKTRGTALNFNAKRDRISDPSLSALLVLEIAIIFLAAPLTAKGLPLAAVLIDVLTWTVVVIIIVLSDRLGAIISIFTALILLSADLWPSSASAFNTLGRPGELGTSLP